MAVADITTDQFQLPLPFMGEWWVPIHGYESTYAVSSDGRVKALDKVDSLGRSRAERVLRLWKRSNYLLVDLFSSGARDVRSVHYLIHEAFNGPIPDGCHVHHRDGDKRNNAYINLVAVPAAEHISQHGRCRTPWNKGLKYGETEAYKKSNLSRKRSYASKCEQTFTLCLDGRTQTDVAQELGLCREQVGYRVRSHLANHNLQH